MTDWIYKGRTWVFGNDITTDNMMPGFTPHGLSINERAKYCMRANRPDWANQVQKGDILIAGRNFGMGSARPAAMNLKVLGISCVVAEGINALMLRNCINLGLPALPCSGVSKLFIEGDIAEVDLKAGTVVNTRNGELLHGFKLPEMLLDILASGGTIPLLEREGYIRKIQSQSPNLLK